MQTSDSPTTTPPALLQTLIAWRLQLNDVRRNLELAESEETGTVRKIVNAIGATEDQLDGAARLLTLAREVLTAERDEVHDSPSAAAQWDSEWAENNGAPKGFAEADFDAAIALLDGMIAAEPAKPAKPAEPSSTELLELSTMVIEYIEDGMDGDGLVVTDDLSEEHGISIVQDVIHGLKQLGYKLVKA